MIPCTIADFDEHHTFLPLITVNSSHWEATAEELAEADEFSEEQTLASQDLGNEPTNQ